MKYTSRKCLTILKLTEERATLSFNELSSVLMEKPSNIVYVELAGMLYGIVTTGDISRALNELQPLYQWA